MAKPQWKRAYPSRPGNLRRSRRWTSGSFSGGTPVSSGGSSDGTPRRPYGWLILFVVLSIVITTFWFRENPTGPLHTFRVGVHTVSTPLGAGGKWLTSPMRRFIFWVSDLGVSRSELQTLREQNDTLRAQVVSLEEAHIENERLRDLLGEIVVSGSGSGGGTGTGGTGGTGGSNSANSANSANSNANDPANIIPVASATLLANVIGLPSNSYGQIIVLNKGTIHGVELYLPVISARGLLGQVIEVGPNYSRVRLITDQNSGVAALIQRDRQPGIVRGTLTGELILDFVPTDAEILPGDVVLTSGLGGIYPKGLVIGEVISASEEINTLYKTIKLRSMNSMSQIEEVLILLSAPPGMDNLPEPDPAYVAPDLENSMGGSR